MFRNPRYPQEGADDPRRAAALAGRWRGPGAAAPLGWWRASGAAALAAALAGCAVRVAAPAPVGHGLRLLTEPGQIAPIYAAIAAAHTSIEMTMYELEDRTAERALAAAARRGVTVRVLLDGGAERGANAAAFAYLCAHRVHVRWSPGYFARTHQKTLTIDHRRSLVMTLNLTAQYYANTRDFAVWVDGRADVAAIESVFDADWTGRRTNPPAGSGDLVWSPGAGRALGVLIGRARASVDVESEELGDQPIIAALCRAARRRVRVRVVMTYTSEWASALVKLASCGASVRVHYGETPLYIHAKEIVADGMRAFIGSQNLSYDSLERNRELGLIVSNRAVIRSLVHTFNRDFRSGAVPR